MHGAQNIQIADAQQAKLTYIYGCTTKAYDI
jgi:hypothetical protein